MATFKVLFSSAFRYEGAPNITHALRQDGSATFCGRREWATEEGVDHLEPDCLRCCAAMQRLGYAKRDH